jgi:hypothetical protein
VYGEEAWNQEAGRFYPVEVSGREFSEDKDNLDILNVKRCKADRCRENGWLPSAFNRCPRCGEVLIPIIDSMSSDWAATHGNLDGTRTIHEISWSRGAAREKDFPVPKDGGQFGFVISGDHKILFAVDREHGQIFSYSMTRGEWLLLAKIPSSTSIPSWSWAAVPSPNGIVIPTSEGPFWISIPGIDGHTTLDGTDKDHPSRSVGGAIVLNNYAFVPVERKGRLALALRLCKPNENWHLEDIGPDVVTLDSEEFLGIPARNGGGDLFWSGKAGFLSVHFENKKIRAMWHPWKAGHIGCPRYPVYRDRRKAVWQLCFNEVDRHYMFFKMTKAGLKEFNEVRGPHISVGEATFMGDKCFDVPWEGNELDFYPGTENVIFPIAALGNGTLFLHIKNEISTKRFVDSEGQYQASLHFRKPTAGEERLMDGIILRNPWGISIFFFGGRLYVYQESLNECCFFEKA